MLPKSIDGKNIDQRLWKYSLALELPSSTSAQCQHSQQQWGVWIHSLRSLSLLSNFQLQTKSVMLQHSRKRAEKEILPYQVD